ncbi:DEAD/DEAH box helicase [Nostocoides australiense]|nr:DEAD/DEAH box helicase [Tetrasphaera australiensis]
MTTPKKKPRWSAAQKAAAKKKDAGKGKRGADDAPRAKKPRWVDGKPARPESSDKGKRRRDDSYAAQSDPRDRRPSRDDRRDDRGSRPYGRDERRDDRGSRPYGRDERRDDRGSRPYGRDERGRNDRAPYRDDRGSRPYGRDERGRNDREDRGARAFRDDRGNRGYRRDRDDRPFREERDRRPYGEDRDGSRGRDDRRPFREDGERGSYRDDRGDFRVRDERRPSRDDRGSRDDRASRENRSSRDDRGGERFGVRPWERDERPTRRPAGRAGEAARHTPRPVREERARSRGIPDTTPPPAPASVDHEDGGPTFADLGLPEAIVTALASRGIRRPFPIQAATIPDALAAKDLLGRGQTGSGKTMAFGLPTIARLSGQRATPNRPRALVLVPTRELALQVSDALEPISRAVGVSQKVVAGGMPYPPQLTALDRGVDLIVATPGRLQDLIERGAALLDDVEIVILDEADHMADLGFLPEVTEIMDLIPEGGQRLLFSATLDRGIDELAQKYLVDPVTHSTDDPTAAVSTMEHRVLLIEPSMKKTLTAQISGRPGKTLVFVRTQLGADRVARQLRESGIMAGPIHGGLNQSMRNKVLEAFKDGRLQVLVATDVAARGIHVDDVSQVVQVDPPADHKTYVHRAGRTARAGSTGAVVTLALPHQRKAMEKIIEEVALSIAPERLDNAGAAAEGVEPSERPVPDEVWQSIIAPRPMRGRRGPGRPRPDGAPRRARPAYGSRSR